MSSVDAAVAYSPMSGQTSARTELRTVKDIMFDAGFGRDYPPKDGSNGTGSFAIVSVPRGRVVQPTTGNTVEPFSHHVLEDIAHAAGNNHHVHGGPLYQESMLMRVMGGYEG